MIFKNSKNLHTLKLHHILIKITFSWSKRIEVFVVKICYLELFNIKRWKLSSSFFQNIFHCNIPTGHGFTTTLNLSNSFKYPKSYNGLKINVMNKNSYFKRNYCVQGYNYRRLVGKVYDELQNWLLYSMPKFQVVHKTEFDIKLWISPWHLK